MDELKNLLQSASDRITNPIGSIFVTTWLIVNWKILIILIYGVDTWKNREQAIQNYLSNANAYYLLIDPLLVTVVYLFVFPLLREWYTDWLEKVNFRIARKKLIIENDLAEVGQYRSTIAGINSALRKELQSCKSELELMQLQVKEVKIILHKHGFSEDSLAIKTLSSAEERSQNRMNKVGQTLEEIKNFFTSYDGSLPDMYLWYAKGWIHFRKKEKPN